MKDESKGGTGTTTTTATSRPPASLVLPCRLRTGNKIMLGIFGMIVLFELIITDWQNEGLSKIVPIQQLFDQTNGTVATTDNTTFTHTKSPWLSKNQFISGSRTTNFGEACHGKEPLVQLLLDANISYARDLCDQLPLWESVTELYGDKPILYGLETCGAYRNGLEHDGSDSGGGGDVDSGTISPRPRIAGMFNTGTNALAQIFLRNLGPSGEQGRKEWYFPYDVIWGKHSLASYRLKNQFPQNQKLLESPFHGMPIVLIRDPYRWMQSMCKQSYTASWTRMNHCPNLINHETNETYRVEVRYLGLNKRHRIQGWPEPYDSLVDYWNQWNRQYVDAKFPRLMTRFEDILFHQKEVFEQIMNCIGLRNHRDHHEREYQYGVDTAKNHGRSSDLVSAIIKYGTDRGRTSGFMTRDLQYAKDALDPELLQIFRYKHPTHSQMNI